MLNVRRTTAIAAMGAITLFAVGTGPAASADPIGTGEASAFGITAALGGTEVIPPTPTAETTAPADGETSETVIGIPGDPLAINGTLIARSAVHTASDLASELAQSEQTVAGPYNARAIGQVEALDVLLNEGIPGGQLLNADLIRGEAVAVCSAGAVQYSAESEVVNLQIADQDPLSGPLNDLIDQITQGISDSPLADVIDIDANVLTVDANGAAVDALVVTVLAAAGEAPLAQLRIGHAEVSGVGCGSAPECSDGADNDGDAAIDAADPGCHTDGNPDNPDTYDANDDSEASTQCSDGADNDDDEAIDAADPGCHSNGDATDAASYVPSDDDETNGGAPLPFQEELPITGGAATTGLAAALAAGGLALVAARRRLV